MEHLKLTFQYMGPEDRDWFTGATLDFVKRWMDTVGIIPMKSLTFNLTLAAQNKLNLF
jgi:hypothetical protein